MSDGIFSEKPLLLWTALIVVLNMFYLRMGHQASSPSGRRSFVGSPVRMLHRGGPYRSRKTTYNWEVRLDDNERAALSADGRRPFRGTLRTLCGRHCRWCDLCKVDRLDDNKFVAFFNNEFVFRKLVEQALHNGH